MTRPPAPGSGFPRIALFPALLMAVLFAVCLGFLPEVARGNAPSWAGRWVPSMGVEAAFRLDGLSLTFALLITGIGALVMLYTGAYFRGDPRLGRLLILLTLFGGAMLGLVLADDLITFFVFWEATTVTSFLLVGVDHEKDAARKSALQALMVTAIGGLALLAGLVLLAAVTGSGRFSAVNAAGSLGGHGLYPAIFLLVLVGALTKSAQVPFHFWLPNAMAAPTPVSAYLHSATMVKAGIYLLARLMPALGGTEMWFWLLVPAGAATMLLGSIWALRQVDLKLMMAFTTLMALGQLVLLLGIGTGAAITAALVFLVAHAFYKASLFLAVGMIDKATGTRDYTRLSGLARAMPVTAGTVALAAASMAGLIPFIGFIAKELIYGGLLAERGGPVLVAMVLAANAMMVVTAAVVALRPFRGERPRSPVSSPTDPGWLLAAAPILLACLGVVVGIAPSAVGRALIAPAAEAVGGLPTEAHLGLWHGLNLALALSVATWLLGGLLYLRLDPLRDRLTMLAPRLPRFEGWYDAMMVAIRQGSVGATGRIQTGRMTFYLRMTFITLAGMIWLALLSGRMSWPGRPGVTLVEVAIIAVIIISALAVLGSASRMAAITALGGVGAGVAMIFTLYGAIDVAMTQLFVEILVVIFIAVAFVRLPMGGRPAFRPGNAAIAAALGLGVTGLMLSVLGTEMDTRLSDFFEAASYEQAHGRNIVNVILVDFRGFDTLGEIAVVLIAGIAAIAALRAGRGERG